MADILIDMALLTSAKGINKKKMENNGIIPENFILEKHKIDSMQFAESNKADTVASGDAYYQTVDPDKLRATLDEWKSLNGFIEPLPNTTASINAVQFKVFTWSNGAPASIRSRTTSA